MWSKFAVLAALVLALCAWPSSGPAPVATFSLGAISSISTTGGNAFLTMSSGLSAPQCAAVSPPASATPAITLASTSTSATLSFPPMAAGTYTLVCSNAGSDGFAISPALFSVSSVTNPPTIFGANLISEYLALLAYLTCTGGCTDGATVTAWADVLGVNNLTCTGGVTYHAASTHWIMPSIPIVTFDGTSGICSQSSFALGSTTVYELGGFYPTGTGGFLMSYSTTAVVGLNLSASQIELSAGGGSGIAAAVPYTATNNGFVAVGGVVGPSTSWSGAMSWSNGTVFTSSGTSGGAIPTSDAFAIGARSGGTLFAAFETSEVDIVNALPSSLQRQEYVSFVNLTQGVDALPALTMMTTVQASTALAPTRIQGVGFNMPTVTVADGIGALSIVNSTQKYLDLTTPSTVAGTHDVTVANPDGRSVTFNNAATWSSPANPTPEMILGDQLDMWLEGGVVLNGSNVATWIDSSGLGNNAAQPTGADQPSYVASDSVFGGKASLGSTGSPVALVANMQTSLTGTGISICTLMYETIATNGPNVAGVFNAGNLVINNETSVTAHTPFTLESGPGVWGSGLSLSTPYWSCARKTSTGTVTFGENINNGTEATGTNSSSATYAPVEAFVFSGGTSGSPSGFWPGHLALVVIVQGNMTSTQLTQLHAYACAGIGC